MLRQLCCLSLFVICFLAPARGSAQAATLLTVSDARQVSELQLAKVMAEDSSIWLSVRLLGRARLALVTAESDVEAAPAADAWLHALDFATRVRVAAPSGALSGCEVSKRFAVADSGLAESQRVAPFEVSRANSELALRRLLADAGLPVDVERVAQFTTDARPPFQVQIYDLPAAGGRTEALRLHDRGHPGELPKISISGARTLPLSLIALAKEGVLPLGQESADPSEFPVAYRALDTSCDYLSARADWAALNPTRWLNEVQASAALFAWTVFPSHGQIPPAISRYFEELSGTSASSCELRVRAAHVRGSVTAADFVCGGADDLAQSLSEVGFAELRVSRFFGSLSAEGSAFRVATAAPRGPLLLATDLDQSGCPELVSAPPNVASDSPGSRSPSPVSTTPIAVSAPNDPYYEQTPRGTPVSRCEGSCSATGFDSGSNDSCNGDSSSSDSSSESCSGDSSSSDSASDSCSGDSSAGDSGPDSCSGDASDSSSDDCGGDSSDSSSDSSGCGKSEYDGDTCSGNSENGNAARAKGAALRPGTPSRPRPRNVRLSLLTLLAAALALPLRRRRSSR